MASTHVAADICLYGTAQIGAGYLVATSDGAVFGDHAPCATRSMTEAVWQAVDALRARGILVGTARIFHPGGARVSVVDLACHVPTFGSLPSAPAAPAVRLFVS